MVRRMLNWDEIREMHDSGIEFGSHTVTHTILTRLPTSEIARELQESRKKLWEQLRVQDVGFAYPNGSRDDFDARTRAVVCESGYSYAVTCSSGANDRFSDRFELKRSMPWQKEIEIFRFKFFLQRQGLAS
jgi:peptidoglycan/xylan/chitin deacetylase (PgdA/CDA1 family)